MRRLEFLIWLMAAAALLIDPLVSPEAYRLARDKSVTEPAAGDFREGAIDPTTDMVRMPRQFEFLGSWTAVGPFHGEYHTIWFRPERQLDVLLAGTPRGPGSTVQVEFGLHGGGRQVVSYAGPNPGRSWSTWRVTAPRDALRLRIVARNDRTASAGWLAFSAPRRVSWIDWSVLLPLLKVTTMAVLAWVLLCGPGLLWLAYSDRPLADLALAIFPGPLLLGGLGLVVWISGSWLSGPVVARGGVGLILAWLMYARWRSARSWWRTEWLTVIAGSALLAGFAIAKANVSLGPPDELYGGTISRSLEVGPHSDSRISYGTVQVTARHLGPFSAETKRYFFPYSFGSRGPLAGWLATPLVLAGGAQVPEDIPEQPWRPFDIQGFVTYRIALIVLASLSAWALWGVAYGLGGRPVAQLAVAGLLLTPFFAHELYFTWPKLMSAAGVFASFYGLRTRRSWLAGFALGVGYLCHPGALLSAPFLACWTLGDRSLGTLRSRWWQAVRLGLGTFVVVLPWYILGRWDPHAIGQDSFLSYFHAADGLDATWSMWWPSRWDNFANTFIPGYVMAFHSNHWSYNSVVGPSGGWVHFSLMYWTALPFSLGLPLAAVVWVAVRRGATHSPRAAAVTLWGPALFLMIYWGSASTGIMRQCGHVLFLTCLVFSAWSLAGPNGRPDDVWARVSFLPWFVALRCVDLLVMAFGSALQTDWQGESVRYLSNDLVSLTVASACLTGTAILVMGARIPASPIPKGRENSSS